MEEQKKEQKKVPETWKKYRGIPKKIKTTEELTGHDVSGT